MGVETLTTLTLSFHPHPGPPVKGGTVLPSFLTLLFDDLRNGQT
jgi:hypothetical protein